MADCARASVCGTATMRCHWDWDSDPHPMTRAPTYGNDWGPAGRSCGCCAAIAGISGGLRHCRDASGFPSVTYPGRLRSLSGKVWTLEKILTAPKITQHSLRC
jgi:hypothetical protein